MTTKIKNSRMIPFSDVPEVQGFSAKFVYNFFTPDEMENDEGFQRFHGALDFITDAGQSVVVDTYGHQADISAIDAETPRFIELNWEPSAVVNVDSEILSINPNTNFLESYSHLFNDEGSMNSPIDAQYSYRDSTLRSRLSKKIKLFGKIADDLSASSTVQQFVDHFEEIDDIDSGTVQNLLSKFSFVDSGYVNERKTLDRTTTFLPAEDFELYGNIDRRVGSMIFNPIFSQTREGRRQYEEFWQDNNTNFALMRDESNKIHFELGLKVLPGKSKLPPTSNFEYAVQPVGYLVQRTEPDLDTGLFSKTPVEYYVDGADSTRFIDTKIVYSKTYRYKISAIYVAKIITAIADDPTTPGNENGFYRMYALIKSKASKSEIVKTEELTPPAEPDGVLYRYNYDEGTGLLINWQMPSGKQRDIKYFQVFRRRNIKEPFTCIAELDFNDVIKSYRGKKARQVERAEIVRGDRRFKFDFPRTFFNDTRFGRESKFIYAIAAVDAHGLTSGYSAQVEVGFNRSRNSLTLKSISRPGAPKQYPNFFIDPSLDDNIMVDSLTSDSMRSSNKQEIHVFLDPDAKYIRVDGTDGSLGDKSATIKKVIGAFNKDRTRYVLNILNVDRQIAKNVELKISDTRSD